MLQAQLTEIRAEIDAIVDLATQFSLDTSDLKRMISEVIDERIIWRLEPGILGIEIPRWNIIWEIPAPYLVKI
jgi:hypothetical protein